MARDLFEEAGIDPTSPQTGQGRDLFAEAGITPEPEERGFLGNLFDYADVAAGGITRGVSQAAGLPVDALNSVLNLFGAGTEKPAGGSEWFKETLMPNPPKPQGLGQKIVGGIGEQIGGAAVPLAGVASKAKMTSKIFNTLLGNLNELPLSSLLKAEALTAGGAGTGSGIAREYFPDSVTADVVGQLAGGIGVSGANALIKKAIGSAKNKVVRPFTQQGAREEVSGKLKQAMGEQPIYKQNFEATDQLAQEIPGLRPTTGQATNAPNMIVMERGMARKSPDFANQLMDVNRTNREAVDEFAGAALPSGNLEATGGNVRGQLRSVEDEVTDLLARANLGKNKQESGKAIFDNLREAKGQTRERVSGMFDEVEKVNPKLESGDLKKTLKKVSTPMHAFEGEEDFPPIIKRLEKFFGPEEAKETMNFSDAVLEKNPQLRTMLGTDEGNTISFKDLRGLRSEIAAEIRKEKGYPSPNEKKVMRLGELQQSVQRTLDQLGNEEITPALETMVTKAGIDPELRNKYEMAVKAYREDYVPYKQGATRDVLRAGATGEEPATPYSAIAGKFFKSGRGAKESAQEFIKNVGSREDAAEALKDYAYRDLADFATDPNTGKLNSTKFSSWFKSRQEALSEFPELRRDLFNIKTAQKKVDELSKVSGYFDGDSEKTMQRILTSKNPRGEMDRVRRLVQDDPESLNGLKQGFWTDSMEKAKTRRLDIGGEQMLNPAALRDHMKKYSAVYDRLYTPQEKANLEKIQKAYETIMRSDKTPLGTGSDTAENMNMAASLAAWAGTKIIPGGGTSLFMMGAIRRAVTSIGKGPRKALLEQALINPEIAKDLITMSKSGPSKAVMKRLNAHLVNLPYAGEED